MNGNNIGIIVVIVLVILGGWFFLSGNMTGTPSSGVTNQVPAVGSTTPEMIVENLIPDVTVTYTDQGFSPKSITIPLGTKVIFVNQSTKNMWVASAKHPDHTVYSGTSLSQHCPDTTNSSFDQCSVGTSYTFTFSKAGTWKYHNHVNPSDYGTIIVATATSTPSAQ
ncbi:MAG: hypothetical protein Q8P17_00375 [bacterium]|nr:hypothetical protein [bacterium]